jgi:hypothetical protein
MKFALSAIALGIGLACASRFAMATPAVTASQSGSGNTAVAEQSGFNAENNISAVITQLGNDNHVGGPGGTTGGIVQYGSVPNLLATVAQTGTGNNAGVMQGSGGPLLLSADITQVGNMNSAMVRQEDSSGTDVIVKQNGTGNATDIKQNSADTEIRVTQNGTNNSATIVDQLTSMFFGPSVEQNGDGNTATATATNNGLSDHSIVQTGSRNNAITNQTDTTFATLSIQQLGAVNRADISQAEGEQSALINQNGNDNVASITQDSLSGGPSGNSALITQAGSINYATIRQVGGGFASTVSQTGSGNYANVYQH